MDTQCQKCIPSHLSGEVETGNAGEQPVRNNLTDWNGHGGATSPHLPNVHFKKLCLGKPNRKHEKANFLCKPMLGLVCNIKNVTV
jgi:hypothetical protein